MVILKNQYIHLLINPLGAEIQELQHVEHGHIIWKKDDSIWNRFAPILFPIVGRLLNDQHTYDGKKYTMRQHGFARDQVFEVLEHHETSVTLCIKVNDHTRAQYPFDFELRVNYELIGSILTISHEVINTDTKDLLFSIGGHPGFHIDGNLNDYALDFGGEFAVKQHLIAGNYYNGETKDIYLNRTFNLSDSLFASDAIVIKSPPFQSIGFGKKEGPKLLTLHSKDWSAVGLWTKPGAPFFCIEPWWGWADDMNSVGSLEKKGGMITLSPGRYSKHEYSIEVHS
jgi:galactose mutarotase-like enzyme